MRKNRSMLLTPAPGSTRPAVHEAHAKDREGAQQLLGDETRSVIEVDGPDSTGGSNTCLLK